MNELVLISIPESTIKNIVEQAVLKAFENHQPPKLNSSEPDPYLNKKEAAKLLRCSVSTIDNYRRAGALKRYNFGSSVRFKRLELLEMIEELATSKKGG